MAGDEDGMETGNDASSGKRKVCKRCNNDFSPPNRQGNHLYCSEVCKIMYSRPRSSIGGTNGEKRKRTLSVQNNSQNSLDDMSREDMITLIKDLKEERETLIQEKECIISHTKEIESELTSIKVKIANRFLDRFFGDGRPTKENEPPSGMDSQLGKSYAAVASKSVTIIAELDPDVDTSNFNGDAMDEFFQSNSEYPTLQSFTKRDNIARFKFNNDADAKKAKQLMEADGKIKASVKSVSERKIEYPIAVFGTGIENLEVLKKEMEFRNEILRGKISRIKPLSKQKGHVKIYVTSKKCEEEVIQARKISVKNASGEFKEHRVEKSKLDFEVTYCYKCKKLGHVAFKCTDKSAAETCGRCAESHKTQDCIHPDSKMKCVNCKGAHKSGDFQCSAHIKAVERLRQLLA
jgi:hypothetical protein